MLQNYYASVPYTDIPRRNIFLQPVFSVSYAETEILLES